MEEIDPDFLDQLNRMNFFGVIALICVTAIMIQFRGLIFSVVSKIAGIDRRKKDNGENGNGDQRRNADTITTLQMENILLKRDNEIDGKINTIKEDLNSKITDSKEELTKLIMEETGNIYAKMDANKGELLTAIAKIKG